MKVNKPNDINNYVLNDGKITEKTKWSPARIVYTYKKQN